MCSLYSLRIVSPRLNLPLGFCLFSAMDLAGLPFGLTHSSVPAEAKKATLMPATTGTSVLGIKFNGGVLLAADVLGSYGSLARYRCVERLVKVNEKTIMAASGDIADFEYLSVRL